MSVPEYLNNVLNKAQQSTSCHRKLLEVLKNYCNQDEISEAELCDAFTNILHKMFFGEVAYRNFYVERCLEFCAKFFVHIATSVSKQNLSSNGSQEWDESIDISAHPLLSRILNVCFQFHNSISIGARYHSCHLITLILKFIGHDYHLDNDICDSIQDAMLQRLEDPKTIIRLQAIKALIRLQEPHNMECPIINAFLPCFNDVMPAIRKEVTLVVAPNSLTVPKLKERIRDPDVGVRQAAYTRCADMNPNNFFRIIDRHYILSCGFTETSKTVKKILRERLLPKWLTSFDGSFLKFLSGLKLDADETDIENTAKLSEEVLDVFLRDNSITDILKYLPMNEEKVIDISNLSMEVVLYWSVLTKYLRKSEEMEHLLENIIPELTGFSNYLEKVIKEKLSKKMDEWECLEYQFVMFTLFDMASDYDVSDEVGRKTLYALILQILLNHKFEPKIVNKIISVASRLNTNVDILINDLCQIISDIREPLVDEPPTQDKLRDREFKMAELRVKITCLEMDKETGLEVKDFQRVQLIHNELVQRKREMEVLENMFNTCSDKVRVSKNDPETVCRCLDILIGLMQLPIIKKMSPALLMCKEEFVMPLLSEVGEMYWRLLTCVALFSLIEKDIPYENCKLICVPIVSIRSCTNSNKSILKAAIIGVADLVRVYGLRVVENEEEVESVANQEQQQQQSSRRKLYSNEDDDVTQNNNKIINESIIDRIWDFLDSELEDVRHTAVTCVAVLLLNNVPVNPQQMSRLVIKWYNPITGKQDPKLQQKLGVIINHFASTVEGAKQLLEKSVMPILTHFANAPRTSSLIEIDMDNVLRFIAHLTTPIGNSMDEDNVHNSLAKTLLHKMVHRPRDICTSYMIKLLTHLNIDKDDPDLCRELLNQSTLLAQEISDKSSLKNLEKFMTPLNNHLKTIVEQDEDNSEGDCTERNSTSVQTRNSNQSLLPSQAITPKSIQSNVVSSNPADSSHRNKLIEVQRTIEGVPKTPTKHLNGVNKTVVVEVHQQKRSIKQDEDCNKKGPRKRNLSGEFSEAGENEKGNDNNTKRFKANPDVPIKKNAAIKILQNVALRPATRAFLRDSLRIQTRRSNKALICTKPISIRLSPLKNVFDKVLKASNPEKFRSKSAGDSERTSGDQTPNLVEKSKKTSDVNQKISVNKSRVSLPAPESVSKSNDKKLNMHPTSSDSQLKTPIRNKIVISETLVRSSTRMRKSPGNLLQYHTDFSRKSGQTLQNGKITETLTSTKPTTISSSCNDNTESSEGSNSSDATTNRSSNNSSPKRIPRARRNLQIERITSSSSSDLKSKNIAALDKGVSNNTTPINTRTQLEIPPSESSRVSSDARRRPIRTKTNNTPLVENNKRRPRPMTPNSSDTDDATTNNSQRSIQKSVNSKVTRQNKTTVTHPINKTSSKSTPRTDKKLQSKPTSNKINLPRLRTRTANVDQSTKATVLHKKNAPIGKYRYSKQPPASSSDSDNSASGSDDSPSGSEDSASGSDESASDSNDSAFTSPPKKQTTNAKTTVSASANKGPQSSPLLRRLKRNTRQTSAVSSDESTTRRSPLQSKTRLAKAALNSPGAKNFHKTSIQKSLEFEGSKLEGISLVLCSTRKELGNSQHTFLTPTTGPNEVRNTSDTKRNVSLDRRKAAVTPASRRIDSQSATKTNNSLKPSNKLNIKPQISDQKSSSSETPKHSTKINNVRNGVASTQRKKNRKKSKKFNESTETSEDETILHTILEKSSKLDSLEDLSIQDVTSKSNTSTDSKKENYSIETRSSKKSNSSKASKFLRIRKRVSRQESSDTDCASPVRKSLRSAKKTTFRRYVK